MTPTLAVGGRALLGKLPTDQLFRAAIVKLEGLRLASGSWGASMLWEAISGKASCHAILDACMIQFRFPNRMTSFRSQTRLPTTVTSHPETGKKTSQGNTQMYTFCRVPTAHLLPRAGTRRTFPRTLWSPATHLKSCWKM